MKKVPNNSKRARKRGNRGERGATAPKLKSMFPDISTAVPSGQGLHEAPAENRGHGPGFEASADKPLQLSDEGKRTLDATSEKKARRAKLKTNQLKTLRVHLAEADDGSEATVIRYQGKSLVLTIEELYGNRKELYKRIHQMGIPMIKKEAKSEFQDQLEAARKRDDLIVATKSGYNTRDNSGKGPQYFCYPNGKILKTRTAQRIYATLAPNWSFSSAGDFSVYEAGVAHVLKDQAAPLLMFFMGLSPVLQRFTKEAGYFVENVVVEMIGPTSTYKSTFTNLIAGSIWGGNPNTKLGPVDKVDSQISGSVIQDCFLGDGFGTRRPDGYGMADHRGAVAHRTR